MENICSPQAFIRLGYIRPTSSLAVSLAATYFQVAMGQNRLRQHRQYLSLCLCVQVRVYELGQLSLKFERHFDAEIVDFQVFPLAHTPFPAVHGISIGPALLLK